MYRIIEDDKTKTLYSPEYNYAFRKTDGFFVRTGKTMDHDPDFSPFGPEIIDMEISTICHQGCSFCYKTNTKEGKNMSLETFKKVFHNLPDTVTQIAFGIGDIDSNPDLWNIMHYARSNGVIPNITINGSKMDSTKYDMLAGLCGAVAVSHYNTAECFTSIMELTNRIRPGNRLKQVNIHKLLSEQTYLDCSQLLDQAKYDARLAKLNAIVFLWLKPKGDRNVFDQVDKEQYQKLVDKAFELEVPIGFDSCSAPMFLSAIKNREDYKQLEAMTEPCESTLFSYYINVDGIGYPCSFTEDPDYRRADIANCSDFINDIWMGSQAGLFRDACLAAKDENGCRKCVAYKLGW